MSKLTQDEIFKHQLEEGEISLNPLPRNALTKLRFEIKETPQEIIRNAKKGARPEAATYTRLDGSQYTESLWELYKNNNGDLLLKDKDFYSYATLHKVDDCLEIATALGNYKYTITPNDRGGSTVEFDGPINAALNQMLLPKMTYVPHTLEGKFVDPQTGKDLTSYMDMSTFGILRAEKNNQNNEDDKKGNSQDGYGFQINHKFNNEIPFLPKSLSGQELNHMFGQRSFERKESCHYQKRILRERIEKRKEEMRQNGGLKKHGAVEADEIAKLKITAAIKSGHSK